jgi:phosphoglycolate phosphatase
VRLGFPSVQEAEVEVLRMRYVDIYRASVAVRTRPFEGVAESLARLESAGIPWGVVTNKPGWLTEPLLQTLALRERARVVISGDSLAERKPHPAPLLHAAAELGVQPADCIYIGDAETDVLAARAAAMDVFVALFGYIPPSERPREWPANGWLETPRALCELIESIVTSSA